MRVYPNKLSARFAIACCALATMASTASAEMWRCTQPDGTVIFSDRNFTGQCARMGEGPPLLRVPSVAPVPAEEAKPEPAKPGPPADRHLYRHGPAAALSDPGGGQGGLRQVDEVTKEA